MNLGIKIQPPANRESSALRSHCHKAVLGPAALTLAVTRGDRSVTTKRLVRMSCGRPVDSIVRHRLSHEIGLMP